MPVILMEGPDNAGKTTIANALAKQMRIPYFKHNHMRDASFDIRDVDNITKNILVSEYVLQFIRQTKTSCILDRNFVSEYVYAQLYRGMKYADSNYMKLVALDALFSELDDSLIVVCVKDYYTKKADDMVEQSMFSDIVTKFVNFTKIAKSRCILLNTTDEDLDSQLFKIMASLPYIA